MDIANVLANLKLREVSDEWIKSTWDNEFYNVNELPSEYEEHLESVNILDLLNDAIAGIRLQFRGGPTTSSTPSRISDASSITWQLLISNDIQLKPLLPVLVYFVTNGHDNISDENLLQICLKATSLYFLLLAIPGSNAFFVFHPCIYEKALETLKLWTTVCKAKKSKQSKSKGSRADATDEAYEDLNVQTLSLHGKSFLIKGLNAVLSDLMLMVNKFPLRIEDALQKTIECLVDLSRLEVSSSVFNLNRFRTDVSVSAISYNAYIVLGDLCNPVHGQVAETVRTILWYLLPSVLMVGNFTSGSSFSELCIIRNHTVHFVNYLLVSLKEEAHRGICIFLQHLCTKITDRADFRQKGAQSVVDILRVLPTEPYFRFIKWLLEFAHDEKASHRLFSLEVILKLLYEEERAAESSECENEIQNVDNVVDGLCEEDSTVPALDDTSLIIRSERRRDISHRFLLGALFVHCLDSSGTVRTKALSTLSDCMKSNNSIIQSMMREIFVEPYLDMDTIDNYNIVERGFMDTNVFLGLMGRPRHQEIDPLPGGKSIVLKMMHLIKDNKVFVRKAALQVLENILKCNRKWMTQKMLKVLCQYCRDPALIVKKQMIQTLTDLLFLYPDDPHLPEVWVESVLPQISNPENKVQEKVLEVLQALILENLVPFDRLQTAVHNLPWCLLRFIIDLKKRKFFTKACLIWARTNAFPRNLLSLIESHIGSENNVSAWMFLACIAQHMDIKKPQFVLDYYREMYANETAEDQYAVVQALDVLGCCWRLLKQEEQDQACVELLDAVRDMRLRVGLIGPVLDVVTIICQGQANSPEQGQEEVSKWADDILNLCISFFESQSQVKEPNPERFLRYLSTLGTVAQLCPGKVKHCTVLLLLGLLFPKDRRSSGVHWQTLCRVPGLQAVVVITIGKVCLQDEILAKPMVRVLGKLLTKSNDLAVKLNTMNALADLCVRYTAMVEPLVPEMCLCLKDQSTEVREGALVILIRLLQQDYLKLRGPFFFHLLSMFCDQDVTVRELANYYFTECLLSKNKHIMHQNIVESIFHFNKYKGHELYSKINESSKEELLFNLAGPDNRADRHRLYRYMCDHMDDEHRMKTTHKICTDILGGITNNKVKLNEVGMDVARDAFFVLSCDEIHLNQLRTQSEDEPPTEDEARVTAVVTTIKKTIITECAKKQVLEINLPILIQLKQKLKAENSLLHIDLVAYMADLLKDYKNEIKELLSSDKTMADEILYDINKAEQNKHARKPESGSDHETGDENAPNMLGFTAESLIELVQLPLRLQERGSTKSPSQVATANGHHTPNRAAVSSTGNGVCESEEADNQIESDRPEVSDKPVEKRKSQQNAAKDVGSSVEKQRSGAAVAANSLKENRNESNAAEDSCSSAEKQSSCNSDAAVDSNSPKEKRRSRRSNTAEDLGSSAEKQSSCNSDAAVDSNSAKEKRRSRRSKDLGSSAEKQRSGAAVAANSLKEKRRSRRSNAAEDSIDSVGKLKSSTSTETEEHSSSVEERRISESKTIDDISKLKEKRRSRNCNVEEDSTSCKEKRRSRVSAAVEESSSSGEEECDSVSDDKRVSENNSATESSIKRNSKKRSIEQMSERCSTDNFSGSSSSDTPSTRPRCSKSQPSKQKHQRKRT